MAGQTKVGGFFAGAGALVAVGVIIVARLGHAAEGLGHLMPTVDRPIGDLATGLDRFANENKQDEIFVSALCNSVAGVVNQRDPNENVGATLKSAIGEEANVPIYLPQDKIDQLSAALKLSQWNSGMAVRYVRVCGRAGFPTRG